MKKYDILKGIVDGSIAQLAPFVDALKFFYGHGRRGMSTPNSFGSALGEAAPTLKAPGPDRKPYQPHTKRPEGIDI